MSKDLSSKKCFTCEHASVHHLELDDTHAKVYHCYYLVKTYPDGIPCTQARMPGRFCGPDGECYHAKMGSKS